MISLAIAMSAWMYTETADIMNDTTFATALLLQPDAKLVVKCDAATGGTVIFAIGTEEYLGYSGRTMLYRVDSQPPVKVYPQYGPKFAGVAFDEGAGPIIASLKTAKRIAFRVDRLGGVPLDYSFDLPEDHSAIDRVEATCRIPAGK